MRGQNATHIIPGYSVMSNRIIGQGATGYVYQGIDIIKGTTVAIKAINMIQVTNQVTQYLLEGQKNALNKIQSEYVVKMHDIFQQKKYCYIVMEYYKNGTLKDYISRKGKLKTEQIIEIFRKILIGYIAIIDKHIIHRDLKTVNIMLDDQLNPKIIDFGYCQMIMGKRPLIHYNVGSPSYMSPEAYYKNLYSQKSDIWALGIILYELINGRTLDNGANASAYFQNFKNRTTAEYNNPQIGDKLLKQLLEHSLTLDPSKRATAHKLKYLIDKSYVQANPVINKNSISFNFSSNKQHKSQNQLQIDEINFSKLQEKLPVKNSKNSMTQRKLVSPKYSSKIQKINFTHRSITTTNKKSKNITLFVKNTLDFSNTQRKNPESTFDSINVNDINLNNTSIHYRNTPVRFHHYLSGKCLNTKKMI